MGEYKHGKQKRLIDKEVFWSVIQHGEFKKRAMHKAFIILLWYCGCRVSEIIELKKSAFEINKHFVLVDIPAKKKGIERDRFQLSRKLPYVENLVEYVNDCWGKKRKVFPFNRKTAWNIVKRSFGEKYYPHFFRLNRCVNFLNNPEVTLNEVRQWFGWKSLKTVENYLGYSDRTMGKLSKTLE